MSHTPHKVSEHQLFLNLLLNMCMNVFLVDQLEGTKYYCHEVKMHSKRLLSAISPIIDSSIELLSRSVVTGKVVNQMVDAYQAVIKELTLHPVESLPIIVELNRLFRMHPDKVMEKLDITIVEAEPTNLPKSKKLFEAINEKAVTFCIAESAAQAVELINEKAKTESLFYIFGQSDVEEVSDVDFPAETPAGVIRFSKMLPVNAKP